MLDGIFLQWFGSYYGGEFGNFLLRLEQLGFFSYLLPFLIIFALVFGILTKTKIFEENKGVNAIIAFAVGLMALQFGFVSEFFAELFPRLGIGLAFILAVLVLVGLFFDPTNKALNYLLLGLSAIVVVVVLASTAEVSSWWYSWTFFYGNLGEILLIVGVVAVLIALVATANSKQQDPYAPVWGREWSGPRR